MVRKTFIHQRNIKQLKSFTAAALMVASQTGLNGICLFDLCLQARMTGTGPSEQGRPFPHLRRLTGTTHTDSTEADSPTLTCCHDCRLSTTAAVALSILTKVIVRFVFGSVFSYIGLYTTEQIGNRKSELFFDI